jgi:hypothetical protein
MINVDPTLSRENRSKVRMRNTYADLWFVFVIFMILLFSYANFQSINVFKTFWAYGNIAFVTDDSKSFEINKNLTMIRSSYREQHLDQIELNLVESGFKALERQTHLMVLEKDGLKRTYEFKERKLFGKSYILVTMEEEII